MTADVIRRVIAAKDANIDEYLRHCDEAWLVIVADSSNMSTWFSDADQVRVATFTSRFTRVLMLRAFGGELIELTATRP